MLCKRQRFYIRCRFNEKAFVWRKQCPKRIFGFSWECVMPRKVWEICMFIGLLPSAFQSVPHEGGTNPYGNGKMVWSQCPTLHKRGWKPGSLCCLLTMWRGEKRWTTFLTKERQLGAPGPKRTLSLSATPLNVRPSHELEGKGSKFEGGGYDGPPALRDEKNVLGFNYLRGEDAVKVRQGNKMALRSIKRCDELHQDSREFALEHPYRSWMWYTKAAVDLAQKEGVRMAVFSNCYFGGRRKKWTAVSYQQWMALRRTKPARVSSWLWWPGLPAVLGWKSPSVSYLRGSRVSLEALPGDGRSS